MSMKGITNSTTQKMQMRSEWFAGLSYNFTPADTVTLVFNYLRAGCGVGPTIWWAAAQRPPPSHRQDTDPQSH
jgi:hypothetical protein